jgi:hypothetical protein
MTYKKCKGCKFLNGEYCMAYLDTHISLINNCEFSKVKTFNLKNLTLEQYMMINLPKEYLKYKNYMRRNIIPNKNDKILTLRSGFGGCSGMILKVKNINDKYIELERDGEMYLSCIQNWYEDFVVIKLGRRV